MNEGTYSTPTSTKSNSKNRLMIAGVVVVLLILGVLAFVLFKKGKQSSPNPNLPKEVSVGLTEKGFQPNSVTIETGSAVRWTNKTNDEHVSVSSDDHPTNKKYPEMNLGEIPKDSTVVHIFNKPGTYTYHDYFHPERKGTVVVK